MISIYDAQTAKETILKRQPIDEMPVPPSVLSGIKKMFGKELTPAQVVDNILADIRTRGDIALSEWVKKLDGYSLNNFRISKEKIDKAFDNIPPEQQEAIKKASKRVRQFHQSQPITSWVTQKMGGTLGQLVRPVKRVGIYIPAGSAPLPSSVLMSAIPAQVAGVEEIVLITPPQKGSAEIAPITLAAAAHLGITEIYAIGGAQAIAALAYGTESIPAVDKIFGPGNLFVTLAKRKVFGVVGIDNLAGPTETVVVADESARPDWVAADLLAQAEHDVMAAAILLTPSKKLIEAVQKEIEIQFEQRQRKEILSESLKNRSGAILTKDIAEAVELANLYAPEHLCLSMENPWNWTDKIYAAGGIFVGEYSCEVLGDYVAGPSHIMPTSGSARYSSPVNVLDFIHIISLIALDQPTAREIAATAYTIASTEQLDAHANAAKVRI